MNKDDCYLNLLPAAQDLLYWDLRLAIVTQNEIINKLSSYKFDFGYC